MSEEKKDGCCSTGSNSCCCKGSKVIFTALAAILIFLAGMWFAKSNCGNKAAMCPISSMPAAK